MWDGMQDVNTPLSWPRDPSPPREAPCSFRGRDGSIWSTGLYRSGRYPGPVAARIRYYDKNEYALQEEWW
jgi:hypothetical protein